MVSLPLRVVPIAPRGPFLARLARLHPFPSSPGRVFSAGWVTLLAWVYSSTLLLPSRLALLFSLLPRSILLPSRAVYFYFSPRSIILLSLLGLSPQGSRGYWLSLRAVSSPFPPGSIIILPSSLGSVLPSRLASTLFSLRAVSYTSWLSLIPPGSLLFTLLALCITHPPCLHPLPASSLLSLPRGYWLSSILAAGSSRAGLGSGAGLGSLLPSRLASTFSAGRFSLRARLGLSPQGSTLLNLLGLFFSSSSWLYPARLARVNYTFSLGLCSLPACLALPLLAPGAGYTLFPKGKAG